MKTCKYPLLAAGAAVVLIACAPAMAGSWGVSFGLQLGNDYCAQGPSVRTSVYYDQPGYYHERPVRHYRSHPRRSTRTVVYRSSPRVYNDGYLSGGYYGCDDAYVRTRPVRRYHRPRYDSRRTVVVREYPPRVRRTVRVHRSTTCRPSYRAHHKGYYSSGCNRVYRTPRGSCRSYRDYRGSYAPRHRSSHYRHAPSIRVRGCR